MRKKQPRPETIEKVAEAVREIGPVLENIARSFGMESTTIRRWIDTYPEVKEAWEASKERHEEKRKEQAEATIESARRAVKEAEKRAMNEQRSFMRGYAELSFTEIQGAVAKCQKAQEPVKEAKAHLRKLMSAEKARERRVEKQAEKAEKTVEKGDE
jgi:uncharacterized protein YoxC